MTQTINSGGALASAADMTARFDVRTLCQLCSDTTVPVDPAALATSPRMVKGLLGASGRVESACTVGGRYAPADLAALATSGTASGEHLKDIVCGLWMGRLILARPDAGLEVPEAYKDAKEDLEALETGRAIFSFAQTQQAGQAALTIDTPGVFVGRQGPVEIASRYFGVRTGKFPQAP